MNIIKKTIYFIFILSFSLSSVYATEKITKEKDIIVFGKNINITEVVQKDILLINGTLTIDGEVKGDVIVIWGSVNLKDTGKIDKDLILICSKINKGKDAIITGKITKFNSLKELKKVYKEYFKKGKGEFISAKGILHFLLWFILLILAYSFIPNKIDSISEIIKEKPLKNIIAGLIIYIVFLIIIIVFAIMSLFIIGIPFLLLFALLILILKVISRTAISLIFGTWIKNSLKIKRLSPLLILGIGLLFVLLLKNIPYLGSFIIIVFDIIGFGAIYYYKKIGN